VILKDLVRKKIQQALQAIGKPDTELPIRIEYARDDKYGDYACTLAMDKRWRDAFSEYDSQFSNPRKFAEAICSILLEENKSSGFFEKIEIARPGFINLRISIKVLFEFTRFACLKRSEYGKSSSANPRKIIFEFVSANPTGPLNVVSARAAALGDSCCNLLEAAGDDVYREYYVNDYGNQVVLLGESALLRFLQSRGAVLKFSKKDSHGESYFSEEPGLPFPSEGYHGEYLTGIIESIVEEDASLKPGKNDINSAVKLSENTNISGSCVTELNLSDCASGMGKAITDHFVETHRRDLEKFRVEFNNFYSERSMHDNNQVLTVRESISKYIYKMEGKEIFRSTEFGDDKDRVIVRDDGRPTYLFADIAYHKSKIERGFGHIYNIWGPDHHGYIKRLAGAIKAMGFAEENFNVLVAQQVNLLEDGEPVVMSKRTGRFITMKTLMEEIPVDVIRYFFIMRAFESHLDFDITEAKDTSENNPYYYIAYAHARICSIFRKASEQNLMGLTDEQWDLLKSDSIEITHERRRLLWLAARFPEEVRDAAKSLEPHRLITYLYQLAGALSRFYGPKENKIIAQGPETASVLISILDSTAVCLKTGLELLGMNAPERLIREE